MKLNSVKKVVEEGAMRKVLGKIGIACEPHNVKMEVATKTHLLVLRSIPELKKSGNIDCAIGVHEMWRSI